MIKSGLQNTDTTLGMASSWRVLYSSHISSNIRVAECKSWTVHDDLPQEAPQIFEPGYKGWAEVPSLCHIVSGVLLSVLAAVIKDIKHVKHEARMPFSHVANAALEHLHIWWLTLAVQAKTIKDLGKLCISELQSRLIIITSPAGCGKNTFTVGWTTKDYAFRRQFNEKPSTLPSCTLPSCPGRHQVYVSPPHCSYYSYYGMILNVGSK